MNKVVLIGRLSRDPELRHTSNNTPVCQINMAISRPVSQGKDPETDFINVVVWNKQAENLVKYVKKGNQIAIEGRIQTRSYDNEEGKKVYVTEVLANHVEFIGSNSNKTNDNQTQVQDNKTSYTVEEIDNIPIDDPFSNFGQRVEIDDSQLPF